MERDKLRDLWNVRKYIYFLSLGGNLSNIFCHTYPWHKGESKLMYVHLLILKQCFVLYEKKIVLDL